MQSEFQRADRPEQDLPAPGELVGGKYRVEAFIARGGMGALLAARHQVTGRRVALKFLLRERGADAEATHRLLREAQAAARVQHPNVVDVWDVGEHQGALFLVMELLEGQTLAALLDERGALPLRDTLALMLPAMRGVEAAHRNHVVHRDLKPSNVFLCRDDGGLAPTPRVLDFGISKVLAHAGDPEHSLTQTGAVLGTPRYMAPEQLQGEEVDARVDVYALGVMLYQCLSGQLPFKDSNHNALVLQIATGTPIPLARLRPELPTALAAVVMRAMARDAGARFQSVAALIAALEPYALATPSDGDRQAPAHRVQRTTVRWLWLAVVTLALVLAWVARVHWGDAPDAIATEPTTSTPTATPMTTLRSAPATATHPVGPVPEATQVVTIGGSAAPTPTGALRPTPEPESAPEATAPRPRRAQRKTEPAPNAAAPAAPPPPAAPEAAPAAPAPAKSSNWRPLRISRDQF